jgi:predicted transposase YbfD/YdcC
MSEDPSLSLFDTLGQVPDPRRERTKLHQLVDILVIAVCATICAAETWEEIAEFGQAKESWFSKFLALPNGIRSHDTFRRVFLLTNPKKFQASFLTWMRSVTHLTEGEVVSIDGKAARGARTSSGKEGLHMVSAWAGEQRLVLGQFKTEEKSNEITAIPLLLELLELRGCIVTIDAMGCQACRTRIGHAPENLVTLRHMAVNLLKQERSCKLGVKSKRLKAGWDESYMLKVLNI